MRCCLAVPGPIASAIEAEARQLVAKRVDEWKQSNAEDAWLYDTKRSGEECYLVLTDAMPVATRTPLANQEAA